MSELADTTRRGGSWTSLEDRRGFALPAVLLLLMVLSTVTVFFLISSSDQQRAGRAMRESARSFYAADAGVNAVLAEWDSLSYDTLAATPGDSVDLGWRTLENGATYEAVFVRVDGGGTGAAIHSLRVTGQGGGSFGGSTTIFREIRFGGGSWTADAAVKGGIGGEEFEMDFEGVGGVVVSGLDTIPAPWASEGVCGPLEDKPGVVWQDTTKVDVSNDSELVGAPRMVEDAGMTWADLADFGGFTWDDLVSMADITITDDDLSDAIYPETAGAQCKTWGLHSATLNWGDPYDPTSPCFNYFPIIYFANDEMEISGAGGYGQGIMLVEGELEIEDMSNLFEFFGLIIQKGPGGEGMEFEETGINIYGAIIAGGEVEIEHGATVRYSQCAVKRALEAHGLVGGAISERVWRQAMD